MVEGVLDLAKNDMEDFHAKRGANSPRQGEGAQASPRSGAGSGPGGGTLTGAHGSAAPGNPMDKNEEPRPDERVWGPGAAVAAALDGAETAWRVATSLAWVMVRSMLVEVSMLFRPREGRGATPSAPRLAVLMAMTLVFWARRRRTPPSRHPPADASSETQAPSSGHGPGLSRSRVDSHRGATSQPEATPSDQSQAKSRARSAATNRVTLSPLWRASSSEEAEAEGRAGDANSWALLLPWRARRAGQGSKEQDRNRPVDGAKHARPGDRAAGVRSPAVPAGGASQEPCGVRGFGWLRWWRRSAENGCQRGFRLCGWRAHWFWLGLLWLAASVVEVRGRRLQELPGIRVNAGPLG